MISCLHVLFNVTEDLINEDFLEIRELVETEKYTKNRSISLNNDKSDFDKIYMTNYHDVTAYLVETLIASGGSLSNLHHRENNKLPQSYDRGFKQRWYLGANDIDVSKINSENKLKCHQNSCYEKSTRETKICKQGKFYSKYQFAINLYSGLKKQPFKRHSL